MLDINWINTTGLSCGACDNPTATISETTTYEVIVETNMGCTFSQSITLEYIIPPVIPEFYVSNVIDITNPPNDRFFVQSNDDDAIITEMLIFDRWGNKVFQVENAPVNDSSFGWDGTMNNQELTQGVYVYTIKILSSSGDNIIEAGDITLFR